MLNTIRTLALSALVGFGALAAAPVAAQADGIYLNLGGPNDARFGVYAGNRYDGERYVRRDRERDWRPDWRRACSPNRALDKAARMGLRRASIANVNRRVVRVSGFKYGTRVTVMFGNERGCPLLYER